MRNPKFTSRLLAAALTLAVAIPLLACYSPTMTDEVPAFRQQGQMGVNSFIAQHKAELANPASYNHKEAHAALDAISGQKDAWFSQLYWHTDLETAKVQAQREHKPILSLRLLGRLTDDLSCANSRMFRVVLYPDPAVSAYLRQEYVLHWSTEREVPQVTIDFGNGQVMRRTVTGNSAHYVLNPYGQPLDVIPGLYSPEYFLQLLKQGRELNAKMESTKLTERAAFLAQWHEGKAKDLATLARMQNIQLSDEGQPSEIITQALNIQQLTVSKAFIERPILQSIRNTGPEDPWENLGNQTDPWQGRWYNFSSMQLGVLGSLSDQSSKMIKQLAPEKYGNASVLSETQSQLSRQLVEESGKNEGMMHYRIHRWFAQQLPVTWQFSTLNDEIYANLFRTPKSDKWLGMDQLDVFTGLDHEGMVIKN